MFRISNGKFIGERFSFIPPDNFYIALRQSEFNDNGFKFVSLERSIEITVCIENGIGTEEEGLEAFAEDMSLYLLSDFKTVKRGSFNGVGAFFGEYPNSASVYREQHNFYMNNNLENRITVTIEATGWRRTDVNPVYEILEVPPVKEFLESIEYFGIRQLVIYKKQS